jgi:hypothetical protein
MFLESPVVTSSKTKTLTKSQIGITPERYLCRILYQTTTNISIRETKVKEFLSEHAGSISRLW